jgi:integrase
VILPELGTLRLTAITRNRVQDLIDELTASELAASTVHNTMLPLRAIFRRAVDRDEIAVNPMDRVSLPKDRARRDRVAEPRELDALLAVLPPSYRVLWAAAAYTGLRRGELQALRWEAIELDAGILRVTASWDRSPGLSHRRAGPESGRCPFRRFSPASFRLRSVGSSGSEWPAITRKPSTGFPTRSGDCCPTPRGPTIEPGLSSGVRMNTRTSWVGGRHST